METMSEQFASDNYSGVCPEAWDYLSQANHGDVPAYGEDSWTQKACDHFRELFEADCEVFFVFNGTAANSLSLAALCQSYHSVICHETAHIETDECGGPEFASNGSKLLLARGDQGKMAPESIEQLVTKRSDIHYPKPKVITITQSTEVGTVYTVEELKVIQQIAKQYDLKVHMDGARFANALASCGHSPAEITWKAGVDVLCFGGTKNGMPVGEAILFFNKALAEDFEYRCKQAGQLASKMRFITAPWLGLLETGAWLRNAQHANDCARYLADQLQQFPQIQLLFPQEANAVFAEMPPEAIEVLRSKGWRFYTFIGAGGARLMCSWHTRRDTIDRLIDDIRSVLE